MWWFLKIRLNHQNTNPWCNLLIVLVTSKTRSLVSTNSSQSKDPKVTRNTLIYWTSTSMLYAKLENNYQWCISYPKGSSWLSSIESMNSFADVSFTMLKVDINVFVVHWKSKLTSLSTSCCLLCWNLKVESWNLKETRHVGGEGIKEKPISSK